MFFCRSFFFSQCRKKQQGNPSVQCFRKSLVAKIFMDKKGGISRVSVENFLSDSTETQFVAEPYCAVFQRNSSSEKFMERKGWEYQVFLSMFFCLTVPENFTAEPYCAVFQKISGSKHVYRQERGGSIKSFLRFFFRVTLSKNAVEVSFSLSIISATEKVWKRR